MTKPRWTFLALALAAAGLSGCGTDHLPAMDKPAPVKGRVVFGDGTALKGGVVTFFPAEVKSGKINYPGFGMFQKDGTYAVRTTGDDGDNVAPGSYKVVISPREEGDPPGSNATRIPDKYRAKETTTLTF